MQRILVISKLALYPKVGIGVSLTNTNFFNQNQLVIEMKFNKQKITP